MSTTPMCPKYCKVALHKVRVGSVEVDRCPKCEGVWFDAEGGELLEVLRVGPAAAPGDMKKSWEAGGGKISYGTPREYNCPRCGRLLSTYNFMSSEPGSFQIDGCLQGCGVWLDDGELTNAYRILQRVAPAKLRSVRQPAKPGILERILGFLKSR